MTTDTVARRTEVDFAALFAGRTDVFGRDEGRCERWGGDPFLAYQRHLSGEEALGVYPIIDSSEGSMVHWGAVDYDVRSDHHRAYDAETEHDAHTMAINLFRACNAFGVRSWIERTRSCGRHVWVFAERWVSASTMRRALLAASDIAGTPTREVNPKQFVLADGQVGNYLNVPFFGALNVAVGVPLRTRVMLEEQVEWRAYVTRPVGIFVAEALASRATTESLERMAALWTPPPDVAQVRMDALVRSTNVSPELYLRLNGLGRAVLRNGPSGDRSSGLVYLAHQCHESGLSPAETLSLVAIADAAWGKYVGRRDHDRRLQEIVERAWR